MTFPNPQRPKLGSGAERLQVSVDRKLWAEERFLGLGQLRRLALVAGRKVEHGGVHHCWRPQRQHRFQNPTADAQSRYGRLVEIGRPQGFHQPVPNRKRCL